MNNQTNNNNNNSCFIYFKTNLITNFKPSVLVKAKEFNFSSINKKNNSNEKLKNQIYCKNFLIYLLLIKYKNLNFLNSSCIFIKKLKKKIYTILRSPYRHKLARHQIVLNRYEINSSISLKLSYKITINN